MADTSTTHLGLIKQDPDSRPDIEKEHDNLDVLDEEVFARGKKFNGESVGEDGEFHIRSIPYADNLESSSSQRSEETYAIRTSGGEASINDGDAWLMLIRGDRIHTGYTPMEIDMQVIPMVRPAPPAITATLDEETFEAYVGEAGTYTITYTDSWSTSPTLYGLTVSNVPVDGDSITMDWDGENDAVVTVDAVERQAPDAIDATIDEDVFVGYVSQSGTTTLTYSTAWSADPANYGITIIGEPVAGDVITIDYTKEVRGTIIQSDPQTFISTGWNLYNHELGYARVIKYHDNYGFKVSGTYTMLEFATTTTGSRIVINPVSGGFAVPSDGYVFVTGGNDEDTQIWMTWSDWGTTANGGEYAPYSETQVDISTFMATNFPFGLLRAGNARDEINLNTGIAVSNVTRQVYNAQNLAAAKASGRQYEYDENYIYIERAEPFQYNISVDGGYIASDHGLEMFTGSEQGPYAETIYGMNLKNKLERDVVTVSQQTLTTNEQAQVRANIGAAEDADTAHLTSDNTFTDINIRFQGGQLQVANGETSPAIRFASKNNGVSSSGILYCFGSGVEGEEEKYAQTQFALQEYSSDSNGNRLSYYERYRFPAVNIGRTSNGTYDVLTTKSAVSIAQGGTGATTASAARKNLGLGTLADGDGITVPQYFVGYAKADGTAVFYDFKISPREVPSNATFTPKTYTKPSAMYKYDGTSVTVANATMAISRQSSSILRITISGISVPGNSLVKVNFAGVNTITVNVPS